LHSSAYTLGTDECTIYIIDCDGIIEEGRAARKSPRKKFGYFLSMSQQAVSADIIPNSDFGIFSPETEGTKTKAARVLIGWLLRKFRSLKILRPYRITVYILLHCRD
jgi:hypothetical protein